MPNLSIVQSVLLDLALVSAVALGGLLGWNLRRPAFGFWPAPETSGWRHALAFGLFRLFCGATIAFALAGVAHHGFGHWLQLAVGLPLMLAAFGVTLWGYRFLGLDNTYCEPAGLVTGGIYAGSRNPQYVTSVAATLGLGIAAGSPVTLVLAGLLFLLYFLFVLNEERWLAQGYGRAFLDYMQRTPRFVDERSLILARERLKAAR